MPARLIPLAFLAALAPAAPVLAAPPAAPATMGPPAAGRPSPTQTKPAPGTQPGAPAPAPAPTSDTEAAPPPRAPKVVPGLATRATAPADLPPPPADPGERAAWLKARLDELFAAPALGRAKVSVLIAESDTGRPLYARNERTPLNAASNVKLVTSSAALAMLGPEYRFKTTISVAAPTHGPPIPSGGEIAGDLYLRGFGDPTLAVQDLSAMVADLAALGLKKVGGALIVDESFFDPNHVAPAYQQKPDSYASRAPSSAASLNGNVVAVTITPGLTAGAPARISVDPPSAYLSVVGHVVTSSQGPATPTVDTREDGGTRTRVVVAGRIRLGGDPVTIFRRVVHPPLFLGHTLRQLLERRGIALAKGVRVGTTPSNGLRVLASHDSAPLAVVVHDLNKRSNNFAAEQVLRTLGAEIAGRPGTWDKGLEAVARHLQNVGLRRGSYQMTNGAGLYDSNRFTAEQIVTVLRAASRDFRYSSEMLASLAIAGADGTIAHRMGGTLAERYVRAKTGTLAGTSCLSGFAGSPGRGPLVFAFLMNDLPSAPDGRKLQDRAAEILVAYLEAGAAAPASK